ncbi:MULTISPECIES: hypothetical protein [Thalassospira]|uniref:Uncharacterized protein n=2 Tax=Thalassospira tepidiphila TaxID=393657 RepID=A0A853KUU3_9PROT|nr:MULTISPECIES: hypothetical protein [Thalassospira]MBE70223.1 hypothetical protein [Thalassospira sp.]NJB76736.1 hypothetical protein [Thalassospira tepidiphila]OAZ07870.1 hypothetical protein TH4_19940 [Thalassospira tepidiphila MCCC 1A03514]
MRQFILTCFWLLFLSGCEPAIREIDKSGIYGSGSYILTSDINVASGDGLIFTESAHLDLNGHAIRSSNKGNEWDYGVKLMGAGSRLYDTKKTGKISGFRVGAKLEGSGSVSDGVNYIRNRYMGVWASANDITIKGGVISGTSGVSDERYAFGVQINGDDCKVSSVLITEIYEQSDFPDGAVGEGVGINIATPSERGRITETVIANSHPEPGTYGIFGGMGGGHYIKAVSVLNYWRGISVSKRKESRISMGISITSEDFDGGYGISLDGIPVPGSLAYGYRTPIHLK